MTHPITELEPPMWQWTLLDLMIWTTYAAAFCSVVVFFGLDSSPFLGFFLFFSLLMTASLAFPNVRMFAVIGLLCFSSLALLSLPLLANCVMHAAFLGWEKFRNKPVSRKTAIYVSLLFLFISIGGVVALGLGPYRELLELRKQLPVENLAPRLKYEQNQNDSINRPGPRVPSRMTARWEDFELTLLTDLGTWSHARNHYLRQVHDRRIESFIKSQGLGVGRMILYGETARPHDGVLPDLENVPFQFTGENRPQLFDEDNYWIAPQWRADDAPIDFHFAGLVDFLNTTTYGLMLNPRVTIGFEPHAFHFIAEPVQYKTNTFRLSSLQLVSIRRFDKPHVYVLDHLPRMDQLSGDNVPTRELTDFELQSLSKIWDNNEDVVIESGENRLLMLGSIRAVQSCLDCHAAKRGELLGAFSYRFDPIQTINQE